jgi:hypothetical protein
MRRGSVASLAILGLVSAVVLLTPSARSSGFNLVGNPGFETGTQGWEVGQGFALGRVAGGHASAFAAQVGNVVGRGGGCGVSDAPNWIAATDAGSYAAAVWVRNDRGGATVSLEVAEVADGQRVGSSRADAVLTTTWQRLAVEYEVRRPGSSLDLRISSNRKPHKGDPCFLFDDVSVVLDATTPAPAPSPSTVTSTSSAPTVVPTSSSTSSAPVTTSTSTSTATSTSTSTTTSPTATHTHEPTPTATPSGAGPDPLTCTGYPEPRIFYETQSWWEPVPGIGGQGHVHLGVCWPHLQTVSGTVRLDLVAILHGNKGTITRFKVQDDFSLDYNDYVSIAIDTTTGGDATVLHTMWIDTTKQPDGLRQWRLYAYFEHANGNSQRPKAMYQVQVENVAGTVDDVGLNYREYAGAGWYKEVDGTDWGYQAALVKPSSHLAIGECVMGTWSPVVDTDAAGTTEHMVTVDPKFHSGIQGWIVHASSFEGYDGPVTIDTTMLTDGWHRLVVQSAKRVGDEENGGVFVLPFRVCNQM